jgi:hypothetical protein
MDIDTALDELLLTRPVAENDIVQAHRRMAMRFHPDKATDPDEKRWVQQKFVRIQQAYELLKGLPIEIINGSPEHKVSEEGSVGSGEERGRCSARRPDHEGLRRSPLVVWIVNTIPVPILAWFLVLCMAALMVVFMGLLAGVGLLD